MSDLRIYETPILSIEEFEIGLLEKDRVPGLLIRSDENGYYSIGIQINDEEVIKVDSALEDDAIEKIQKWKGKIDVVREQYQERITE
ncbi:MAG TPA: hypothetical protein VFC73_02430 [Syntrophomonadaceae bacterium]|nr:hypothetical protein [Syntrophomonadaceae bacterium]